jgi:hypothetical protein
MKLKPVLRMLVAIAALSSISPRASAQEAPQRAQEAVQTTVSVVLKDGRSIRGEIAEMLAGTHVILRFPGGATVLIPWASIDRVEQGDAPSRGPRREATRPEPEVRAGSVHVHLETTSELFLERQRGSEWVIVCKAPCDEMLPLEGYYRIAGSALRDSKPFRLDGAPGDHLVISTETGSATAYDAGVFMAVTGGLGLAAAGWILYYELINSIDYRAGDGAEKGVTFGLELGATAAVVTTVGIVLIASNPPSVVTQNSSASVAHAQVTGPAPSWRAPEFRGLPIASSVPIFSGTF